MKYQDLWDMHKASEELHMGTASIYEEYMGKGGDPEDLVAPTYREALTTIVNEFVPALDAFADELEEASGGITKKESEESEPDDVVRIVLNIPAAHLSAEERVQLERDMVREAAQYSDIWMQTKEFRMAESPDVNEEEEEYEEAVDNLVSDVELPPEQVTTDIATKWRETYEQMRPDYHESEEMELEVAVLECLIEDGYIIPGPHYNVETVTAETVSGNKTTFVTGPKGSKSTSKENK